MKKWSLFAVLLLAFLPAAVSQDNAFTSEPSLIWGRQSAGLTYPDNGSPLHLGLYGGLAIPSAANTSYTLNSGTALGAQLFYEIPSVYGLSVAAEVDLFSGKGDSVDSYHFVPVTLGVNYVWQFSQLCGLSTHIGVGFNSRSIKLPAADDDTGVTFAYKVGLDLLFQRHLSLGFRWNGLGNTSAYESVPVAWDAYGNVTRYEQRPVQSDEFSLGFFTIIAGIRL